LRYRRPRLSRNPHRAEFRERSFRDCLETQDKLSSGLHECSRRGQEALFRRPGCHRIHTLQSLLAIFQTVSHGTRAKVFRRCRTRRNSGTSVRRSTLEDSPAPPAVPATTRRAALQLPVASRTVRGSTVWLRISSYLSTSNLLILEGYLSGASAFASLCWS
jgi:hypothetical protein